MFMQHYLRNKKPTSLTCNPELVYPGILESLKNNDVFQKLQTYSPNFHEMFLTWFL